MHLNNEIARLSSKLLSDALDTDTIQRLTELRQQLNERREQALRALVDGLEAYLSRRFAVARDKLSKVSQSAEVVTFANAILLSSIAEIVQKCKGKSARPPKVAPTALVVFHLADGRKITGRKVGSGAGQVIIRTESGESHVIKESDIKKIERVAFSLCPYCGNTGWADCESCAVPNAKGADTSAAGDGVPASARTVGGAAP